MNKLSTIIEIIVFYIIGNILFNTIFSLTEVIIAKILLFNMNFFEVFESNIFNNLKLYTVLYFIILVVYYGINIFLIRKLNKKLKRRKENEK